MLVHNFDHDWKFRYSTGNPDRDLAGEAYEETVQLPHDFMIGTQRTKGSAAGGAGGYFQGGIGTYEKEFFLDEAQSRHVFLLLVEGSYGNTEVWINGSLAAIHHYGYTEFHADLTRWLRFGQSNQLKIVVENNAHPNSRWYSGSGLFRHVSLLEGDTVYLAPWSVWVQTPDPDTVLTEVTLTNTGDVTGRSVTVAIEDARGQTVAEQSRLLICEEKEETLSSIPTHSVWEASAVETFEFHIENAHLWSPEDPYLYKAKIKVEAVEEDPADPVLEETREVSFGIRTLSFTRDNGFCLNDQPVKLKGGCIHHDNGVVGSRAYEAMEARKVKLLKDCGYNAIRTSHNPPSTAFLDACDRLGMLVLDEAFDCWREQKNPFDYHLYFEDHWREDLASMILRDRSHPSVILYSTGNEIGERNGSGNGAGIASELSDFVHAMDPARAVTNAVCAVDFSNKENEPWEELTKDFIQSLDVVGYNYEDGRYEEDGKEFPNRLIVGTESYPKEMKQVWSRVMAHPYVLGDFTWTAWDYLGESGIGNACPDAKPAQPMPYPWHTANCGDFDLCGFLRPQGKFRRQLWGKDSSPVLTILRPESMDTPETISLWGWSNVTESYTWPGREGQPLRADIYSDAEEVELRQNRIVLERKAVPESGIVSFDITYEPGTLTAVNFRGGQEAEQSTLCTSGEAKSFRMTLENPEDDAEILIIRAEAVDEENRRVPCWQEGTLTEIFGPAELIGYGSANPQSEDDYTSGCCHFYEGRALLVLRRTEGKEPVRVRILSEKGPGIASESQF